MKQNDIGEQKQRYDLLLEPYYMDHKKHNQQKNHTRPFYEEQYSQIKKNIQSRILKRENKPRR